MPITPARDVQGFLDAGNQMNLMPTEDPRGPSQIPSTRTPFPTFGTQPVGTQMSPNVGGTSGRQNIYTRDIFPPVSGGIRDEIVTDAGTSIYGPDVKVQPTTDFTPRVPSVGQEEFSELRRTDSGVRDVPSFGDTDPVKLDPRGRDQIPTSITPFPVDDPRGRDQIPSSTRPFTPPPVMFGDDPVIEPSPDALDPRGKDQIPRLDPFDAREKSLSTPQIPLRGADVIGTTSKTADQMARINEPLASGLSAPAVAARPTTVDYRDARDKGNLVSGVPLTARGNKN